jgi:hypothetical protein
MKAAIAIAGVLLAARAAADPIAAELGKRKLTITPCTIGGPALYLGETTSDTVVTPDGALLVLDGKGDLHRYLAAKGDDCTLAPDKTFGKDGVLATGIATPFDWAHVTIDHAGAIYVDPSSGEVVRIAGGRVAPMCGDGSVAASRAADHVWRWRSLKRVVRSDGACHDDLTIDLTDHDQHYAGWIWALDERSVAEIGKELRVLDGKGATLRTLAHANPNDVLPRAWAACGTAICTVGEYAFYAWGADGKPLGQFDTQPLAQTDRKWYPHGLAIDGKIGWLVGDEYMDTAPARPAIILRVEGLP